MTVAVGAIWPVAAVQTRFAHLVRDPLRYASKKHSPKVTSQLRDV
jgi:putative transposase